MVRKYNRRRRAYRKKRATTKAIIVRQPRLKGNKNIMYFKRTFQAAALSTLGAVGNQVTLNASISLGNLPSVTDFTNLFDMYKICGIKLVLVPDFSEAQAGALNCNMNSYLDYNDISLPVITTGEQKASWRVTKGTRIHKRYYRPQVPINVTDVSTTSFLQSQPAPWISTNNTNIAHLGLKCISDPAPSAAVYTWRPFVTVYFKCKYVS